jgi:hypothetical protein
MNRIAITMLAGVFLAGSPVGCAKKADSTGKSEPKGNPITEAKGPIGQGGDPAAMAVRRGAQQQKAMADLSNIGIYYNTYLTDNPRPSADSFLKYMEGDRTVPAALQRALKDGDYVINSAITPNVTCILAYEKDKDYQGTRVVVMTDRSVQKRMTEADFQAALKKKD